LRYQEKRGDINHWWVSSTFLYYENEYSAQRINELSQRNYKFTYEKVMTNKIKIPIPKRSSRCKSLHNIQIHILKPSTQHNYLISCAIFMTMKNDSKSETWNLHAWYHMLCMKPNNQYSKCVNAPAQSMFASNFAKNYKIIKVLVDSDT